MKVGGKVEISRNPRRYKILKTHTKKQRVFIVRRSNGCVSLSLLSFVGVPPIACVRRLNTADQKSVRF